jgi:cellular nucleic acid-binding protein
MATHQSEMTEQSMSEADKISLLNSAFDHVGGEEEEHPHPALRNSEEDEMLFSSTKLNEDDYTAMFGEDESSDGSSQNGTDGEENELSPPRKRQRTGIETSAITNIENHDDESYSGDETSNRGEGKKNNMIQEKKPRVVLSQKQQEQLDLAKNKLSKWAARLFDPNRPRGLVEAPQVIPLNDEFLTAFGKREKEYDQISGRVVDIDKTLLDTETLDDDAATRSSDSVGDKGEKQKDGCKVKIANLTYSTTIATIARTCGKYGPVVDVNILLDDNRQSTGRAYVVFEDHESAVDCANKMNEQTLEGRVIRVSVSSSSSSGRKSVDASSGLPGSNMKRKETRYWDRDISTKCHQCGEVGHIAVECPNEEKLRSCALCAQIGHEMWSCPMKCVCFNCGVPGHQSRDCPHRRGLPNRIICTVCFQNGHHRFDCRERPWNIPSKDAMCMQCGQKGHFMCTEMRWFFGLRGVTCFNCGGNHLGERCRRANSETCSKNADVGRQEIEMAGSMALSDQLSNQRSNRESRDSRESRNGNGRAKSLPPSRQRR